MKYFVILITILFLGGCTTAGPFVTGISSDGRGNLNVEKAKVQFNSFMGVISTTETTTTNIKVIPEEK